MGQQAHYVCVHIFRDPLPNSAHFGKGSQRPERGGKGHYCGFTEIFVIHRDLLSAFRNTVVNRVPAA